MTVARVTDVDVDVMVVVMLLLVSTGTGTTVAVTAAAGVENDVEYIVDVRAGQLVTEAAHSVTVTTIGTMTVDTAGGAEAVS